MEDTKESGRSAIMHEGWVYHAKYVLLQNTIQDDNLSAHGYIRIHIHTIIYTIKYSLVHDTRR